jgi:cytochrome c biogenesis protein CcmG/thiol:disulfide interchange protein DsbE
MLLAVVLTIGVAELPKNGDSTNSGAGAQPAKLTKAQLQTRLAGSPPALAALHAEGGVLLGGGSRAWAAQLRALQGRPVVVNKWASWCVPCQQERVVFQRAAADWGRRVAFLGMDSGDTSQADARVFLKAVPVSYPSYYDKSGEVGQAVTDSSFTPVTVFVNARGSRYIHQGPYETVQDLERDIQRYAVVGA